MSYAKKLREQLGRLSLDLNAIVATAKKEERGLTIDERAKFDAMETEYTALEESIKRAERADTIDADLRKVPADQITAVMGEGVYGAEAEKANKEQHNNTFSKYLRFGVEGLSSDERNVMAQRFRGQQISGIRAAQTITTTGGGYLIPTGFSGLLETALKFFGGILGNVSEFTTETGQPIPWPTANDTAQKGRILGVNTQLTETDIAFGQVNFGAYIFTSDSILVPLALIEDSFFNLDAYIAERLGERLGRKMNESMTIGTGGGTQPLGLVPAVVASTNVVTFSTGSTTSVSYSQLVDILHGVDPAYRNMPSAKFMFADSTLKVLRKLVDGSARPLWQPGITAGFGNAQPETILDKPFAINQDMASMAANAYPIVFGDLSKYKVRRVASGTTVMRLVERYADFLQVGYLAFLRADGNLIDAGTHPLVAGQNSAT